MDRSEVMAEALEAAERLMSSDELELADKVDGVLELGCHGLAMRIGICSRIVGSTYTVTNVRSGGLPIERGAIYDLQQTYCERVLGDEDLVMCSNTAGDEFWSRHPAYEAFGLEAYIGAPLRVGGVTVGTLNFSNPQPRGAYTPLESVFVRTLARWVSYELDREVGERTRERLLELSVDPGCELDEDGVVLRANSGFEEVLGVDPSGLEGVHLVAMLPGEERAAMLKVLGGDPEGQALAEVTTRWLHVDGSSRWLDWRMRKTSGGWHVMARDMTSLKLAEVALIAARDEAYSARDEAEAASRTQSAFLSNVSHELRTPLNGMIGMSLMLSETELDETQRDYVRTIQSSASALNALVDDVLDLSKLEAERVELRFEQIEVRAFIEDVALLCAPTAQGKGLGLTWTVEAGTPRRVVTDPVRLRQVLLNLTHNAVKFTDEGQVVLRVKAPSAGGAQDVLCVEVEDTGPGISPEQRDRLFEPFFQLDLTSAKRHGGTGLGLSICDRLIVAMGGSIEVDSELGVGATFRVTVPVEAVLDPAEGFEAEVAVRALVVDDDMTRAAPLLEVGRLSGTDIMYVRDAGEVREALASSVFDVVFIDEDVEERHAVFDEIDRLRVRPRVIVVAPIGESGGLIFYQTDGVLERPVRAETFMRTLRSLEVELARDMSQVVTLSGLNMLSEVECSGSFYVSELVGATTVLRPSMNSVPMLLLVEDNLVNQRVALAFLRHLGYEADVAADGAAALSIFDPGRHVLILMDCQLPVLDGYEVTRRIRRGWPESNVPIIALTAYALESDRARALEAGMDDHLTKPLDRDQLGATLERWLDEPTARVEASVSVKATLAGVADVEGSPEVVDEVMYARFVRDCDGDEEFIEELLSAWRSDVSQRLMKLERLTRSAPVPFEEVHREAHTIKGSSLLFGLEQVVEHAGSLEQMASSRSPEMAEVLAALQSSVAQADERLRQLRG